MLDIGTVAGIVKKIYDMAQEIKNNEGQSSLLCRRITAIGEQAKRLDEFGVPLPGELETHLNGAFELVKDLASTNFVMKAFNREGFKNRFDAIFKCLSDGVGTFNLKTGTKILEMLNDKQAQDEAFQQDMRAGQEVTHHKLDDVQVGQEVTRHKLDDVQETLSDLAAKKEPDVTHTKEIDIGDNADDVQAEMIDEKLTTLTFSEAAPEKSLSLLLRLQAANLQRAQQKQDKDATINIQRKIKVGKSGKNVKAQQVGYDGGSITMTKASPAKIMEEQGLFHKNSHNEKSPDTTSSESATSPTSAQGSSPQ